MRTFDQLATSVVHWAEDKGIFDKSTPMNQALKTQEEVIELFTAIINKDIDELEDAIGDIMVTLIIQAEMNDLDAVECLGRAFDVISKRKGKMVNGMFVKEDS